MKINVLKLILSFLFLPIIVSAQTLKIEMAELAFVLNKAKYIDTLRSLGFRNLSPEEIEDEEFVKSFNDDWPSSKDNLFNKNGFRKSYELRKIIYGGKCKVSLVMKEPSCKVAQKVYWNANLRFDVSYYTRSLKELGYTQVIENGIEKYRNTERGYEIYIKIYDRRNEVMFTMKKVT